MLEALATVVLCGLMLLPLINIPVGVIAGFMLWGLPGAIGGCVVGLCISALYKDRL